MAVDRVVIRIVHRHFDIFGGKIIPSRFIDYVILIFSGITGKYLLTLSNTKSAKNEISFNIRLGSLTNYVYLCTCKQLKSR